jgi:hypothetical protein
MDLSALKQWQPRFERFAKKIREEIARDRPVVPSNRVTAVNAHVPVTASNKRNGDDASLFSPNPDPSTIKRAPPVAGTRNKSRFVDSVSGGAGPDDLSSGGAFDALINTLIRYLNNEAALLAGQSRQAVAAAPAVDDVLMTHLRAKLDRLGRSQKRAFDMGRDAVLLNDRQQQIDAVEREIDDLEIKLLDRARAAAAAENH